MKTYFVLGFKKVMEDRFFTIFISKLKVVKVMGFKDVSKDDLEKKLSLVNLKGKCSSIPVGAETLGRENYTLMAGPCTVESYDQMMKCAEVVQETGGKFLRGGAYKPLTFPHPNPALEEKGLEILNKVKEETGLYIVTEALSAKTVPKVAEVADIIQIGSRNMHNFWDLFPAIAELKKPCLLKRHFGAGLREYLGAAEWMLSLGNPNVILCERGIVAPHTHDENARFILDVNILPALRKYTHLPVICDPSHAAGVSEYVPSLAYAGIAAGANGVIIEFHPEPEKSVVDKYQAIDVNTFKTVAKKCEKLWRLVNDS